MTFLNFEYFELFVVNLYPIESAFYCEFFAVRLDEIGGKLRKLEQKNILRDTKYVECGAWARVSLIAADVTKVFSRLATAILDRR